MEFSVGAGAEDAGVDALFLDGRQYAVARDSEALCDGCFRTRSGSLGAKDGGVALANAGTESQRPTFDHGFTLHAANEDCHAHGVAGWPRQRAFVHHVVGNYFRYFRTP